MKRRERLESMVSGGTATPRTARRKRLGAAVSKARVAEGRGMTAAGSPVSAPQVAAGGVVAPVRPTGRQRQGQRPPRQQAGIGAGGIPGLGHQLTRRLQSGEIDEEQAKRTAKQRQTLKAAYGSDWRSEMYATTPETGGANLQELRIGLEGEHKGDPTYEAALQQILEERSSALARARRLLKRNRRGTPETRSAAATQEAALQGGG